MAKITTEELQSGLDLLKGECLHLIQSVNSHEPGLLVTNPVIWTEANGESENLAELGAEMLLMLYPEAELLTKKTIDGIVLEFSKTNYMSIRVRGFA